MVIAIILLVGCDLTEEKEPLGCKRWRSERTALENQLYSFYGHPIPSDSTAARLRAEKNIIVEKMENAGCDDY